MKKIIKALTSKIERLRVSEVHERADGYEVEADRLRRLRLELSTMLDWVKALELPPYAESGSGAPSDPTLGESHE